MPSISVSLSSEKSLDRHKLFKEKKIETAGEILAVITCRVWSPIVWHGGARGSENFAYSDYCGLDFDDSLDLDDAIGIFKDYRCIITTTENHRKFKKEVLADRFRVVVPWQRRITTKEEYVWNMTRRVAEFGADPACKDAGRLFKPSPGVVFVNDGEPFEVEAPQTRIYPQTYPQGEIPPWLHTLIAKGSDGEPGRNVAAFKIATACRRCGIDDGRIYSILKAAWGIGTLPDNEIRQVIASAKKACGVGASPQVAHD